jgi:hypothetical protein
MSIKWATGAIVAVVAAMFALPGIASAHEVTVNGTVTCASGNFNISASYDGGPENRIITISVNGDGYDIDENDIVTDLSDNDANLAANQPAVDEDYTENGQNLNTTLSGLIDLDDDGNVNDSQFNYDVERNRFASDGHGGQTDSTDQLDNFFAVDGHFDDVTNAANAGSVTVAANLYGATSEDALNSTNLGDSNNPFIATSSASVTVESFAECLQDACVESQEGFMDGEQYEWLGANGLCVTTNFCTLGDFDAETTPQDQTPTSDTSCETLQRCDEGQSLTVTQHQLDTDAGLSDSTAGDCPTDEPITQIVLVVEPEPEAEPEAEVEAAVIEVAAALPSAGYGDTAGASFAWTALAAVALLSIGGGVAVVARRS